ncbi:hypothetical protein EV186_11055 [Labedaea rhizosphaerae]|uniref:Uncharacterized protein n=1 Tax=Labedaea rhizosphaerae TaxID=598644 RepID=A0A4R6RW17_LABRH|nr:hypothetical protein EV186_11055 [Labedaea rhizosphaerae]
MADPWKQTLSCRDVAGRRREVTVSIPAAELELYVQTPPGEVVRLNVDELRWMSQAFTDALRQLEAR